MSKEAMKLALEALEKYCTPYKDGTHPADEVITALREALAKPDFWEGYVPEPVEPAQQALDKKAENARELGLDYEPAQQEPVNKYCCHLCFNKSGQIFMDRMILCPECGNKRCPKATHHNLPCTKSNDVGQKGSIYDQPAQQEPFGYFKAMPFGWTDCAKTDEGAVALYECPPAQRTWVGLTNKDVYECEPKKDWYDSVEFARAIEAKLKEKNI